MKKEGLFEYDIIQVSNQSFAIFLRKDGTCPWTPVVETKFPTYDAAEDRLLSILDINKKTELATSIGFKENRISPVFVKRLLPYFADTTQYYNLKKTLWYSLIKGVTFDKIVFNARRKTCRTYHLSDRKAGFALGNVVYAASRFHNKYDIFHGLSGTLLVARVHGVKDTKVLCYILDRMYGNIWDKEVPYVTLDANVIKTLLMLRKDPYIPFKESVFDSLLFLELEANLPNEKGTPHLN